MMNNVEAPDTPPISEFVVDLDPEVVAKVAKDSLEKYCSVCLMLDKGVEMTHSWEIV